MQYPMNLIIVYICRHRDIADTETLQMGCVRGLYVGLWKPSLASPFCAFCRKYKIRQFNKVRQFGPAVFLYGSDDSIFQKTVITTL